MKLTTTGTKSILKSSNLSINPENFSTILDKIYNPLKKLGGSLDLNLLAFYMSDLLNLHYEFIISII